MEIFPINSMNLESAWLDLDGSNKGKVNFIYKKLEQQQENCSKIL